ncbi:MAG: nucleotidyltransferase domain-containing protein [Pseudomonadota bacterium]
MSNIQVQQAIAEMVRRIVARSDPESIVLFGSHARGTAAPDSDVDLLVVMRIPGSKRRQAIELEIALADVGVPKDVIVVTPEEVARYHEVVGSIVHSVLLEGRVLYERPA